MAPLLDVDTWPELRDPILVVTLSGWVDAGMAGAGAVAVLTEQLEAKRAFGRIDLADLMDLQQTRPTVHLVDGVSREITWPSIDFIAGRSARRRGVCRPGTVVALARGAGRDRRRRQAARRVARVHPGRDPECRVPSPAGGSVGHRHQRGCRRRDRRVAQRLHGSDGCAERAAGAPGRSGRAHHCTVGAGAALRGCRAVAAGDPRAAREGARPQRPCRSISRPSTTRRRPTSSASTRASRIDPTSSRRSARSSRAPSRRSRAAKSLRPRSNASAWPVLRSPAAALEVAGRRAGAGSARPAHQAVSSKHPFAE